jgi:Ca2+-binding EF-hand superfamily protein
VQSALLTGLAAAFLLLQDGRTGDQSSRNNPWGTNPFQPPPAGPRTVPKKEAPPIDIAKDPYLRGFGPKRAAPQGPAAARGALGDRIPLAGREERRRGGLASAGDGSAKDLPELYFQASDQDQDSWISFREASDAFGLDRDGYAIYDANGDGRVTYEEFLARYEAVLARGGVFSPPSTLAATGPARPDPEDMLRRFDEDADQRLSQRELTRVLAREGVEFETSLVLAGLDRDRSGDLGIEELAPLVEVVIGGTDEARRRFERRPQTIDELVARVEPREKNVDWIPEPPRIVGPVSPLRRLDIAGDGWLDAEDLRDLQRPLTLPVRLPTLVAALDTDGDGRLSRDELRASMR